MNFNNISKGSQIVLPELSNVLGIKNNDFKVLNIFTGGMGICLQLQNVQDQSTYGLKRIRPDLIGELSIFERFIDELEIWHTLSECDGVVELIAIIKIDEIPVLVSPWLSKGDLSKMYLNMGVEQKVEGIIRIAKTLDWAHQTHGIIHRDLKPGNILLDNEFKFYVSDWGIARPTTNLIKKSVQESKTDIFERPDRTAKGSGIGTILYASPEQLGDASSVDFRSDIYSLGCILYQIISGSLPFSHIEKIKMMVSKDFDQQPAEISRFLPIKDKSLCKLIYRCLEVDPNQRYQNYSDLINDLEDFSTRNSYSLDKSTIARRQKHYQLGKGFVNLKKEIQKAPIKRGEFAVLDFDQLKPYIFEATQLMNLGRFAEAEKILSGFYISGMIENTTVWHLGHSFALDYAYCLQNIEDQRKKAFDIYNKLEQASEKPVEFYVNYSIALLQNQNSKKAESICKEGLIKFPDDLDLLGNYTIALRDNNHLEEAYKNSIKRLNLRRDIHSISEANNVLASLRDAFRDNDLPKSIDFANRQYNLIREGLTLNPNSGDFHLAKIKLLLFLFSYDKSIEAYQSMSENKLIHSLYNIHAIASIIEAMTNSNYYDTAYELIQKFEPTFNDPEIKKRMIACRMKILAEHHMIGLENKRGERLIDQNVVDYYLTRENNNFRDPIMAARILEWLGDIEEANNMFQDYFNDGYQDWISSWEYTKMLIRTRQFDFALERGKKLIEDYSWRAESYDVYSYCAESIGEIKLSEEMKEKSDSVYAKEMELFESLRRKIDI